MKIARQGNEIAQQENENKLGKKMKYPKQAIENNLGKGMKYHRQEMKISQAGNEKQEDKK